MAIRTMSNDQSHRILSVQKYFPSQAVPILFDNYIYIARVTKWLWLIYFIKTVIRAADQNEMMRMSSTED